MAELWESDGWLASSNSKNDATQKILKMISSLARLRTTFPSAIQFEISQDSVDFSTQVHRQPLIWVSHYVKNAIAVAISDLDSLSRSLRLPNVY